MRSARETLSHLRQLGAALTVSDGRLEVRAPKGVISEALREELAHHKAQILELLGAGGSASVAPAVPIPRVAEDGPAPLSFAQRRLWFLQQLAPENSSYNLGSAVRLEGVLDEPALRESFARLVRRHAILRTTFPEVDGTPVQRVGLPAPVSVESIDLSDVPAEARDAEARHVVEELRRRPFRLATQAPLRVALLRLDAADHVLLVVLHHIGADGWSLAIVNRELATHYAACRAKATTEGPASKQSPAPTASPELPLQYADYARWEGSEQRREVLEQQLAFWEQTLAGAAPLELPTDRPRPPQPSFCGARESVRLPEDLVRGLERLGRETGASLYMTLLAGFTVLLQRYAAEDDVVVGAPAANRNRTELEGLVGCFLNMLTLRTDASGDPSFRELLERVRAVCLAAYRHQDVPFERLVGALVQERDLSRNPLFQVFFALQNTPEQPLLLPGLESSPFEFDYGTTDLDLDVFVSRDADGLCVSFLYSTDLFGAATVRAMADAYRALLESALGQPEQRLSRLALLPSHFGDEGRDPQPDAVGDEGLVPQPRALDAGELASLRGPPSEAPAGLCVHHLFERMARATPERVAVGFEGRQLSYAELDERAERLAAHLRTLGVRPGVLVGIAVERGPDMLAALLAILKAGGAYVPIDPAFPRERQAWLLEDTRAGVLVTESAVAPGLPPFDGHVVLLDQLDRGVGEVGEVGQPASPAAAAAQERSFDAQPSDLAYVIHTSGSTGRPKGVEVSHAAVVNFLCSMARRPGFGPDDSLLAVTTLSFDIAGLELFLPLTVGGRVEIASREVASSGHLLAERLRTAGITVCQATPATWQMLLHAGWDGDPKLKLLCGGEELPRALANELLARGAALWNMYGPTETTIWSAVERVVSGTGPVPLGLPIDGTWLLLLDEALQPVPRGAPGELFIGGAGLARGYLRRPDLSASRFVPSPDPSAVPGRLYRTGDRVRLDADGRLVFLGRTDTQVKLRGYRIELGEIDSRLLELPGVRQAAALVHEPSPGDRRLVAFWVPEPGAGRGADALRERLRQTLPAYMLPSAFVPLDELPLTPAGKIDRRRLASLVPTADARGPAEPSPEQAGAQAPRGPLEAGVHAAFRELLNLERVGIHDDFFALGGHSLLATQLVSRIRSTFQVELSLTQVFAGPSVAGLASQVEALRRVGRIAPPGPIPRVARSGALPLSFAQHRLWLLDQMGSGAGYHMRLELGLSGPLDREALGHALDAVVARHETLRTRFVAEGDTARQVIDPPASLPLRVIERPDAATAEQRAAALRAYTEQDGRQPFDLARGPALRAALLCCADDESVLVLSFHHVLADGRSYELLAQEITALYRAQCGGGPSGLPALPVQYADYAAWQREWLSGDTLEEQLRFWREHLPADLPALQLPTDRPRPPVQSFAGAAHRAGLERGLRDGLVALARQHDATLAMVCLAAFQVLLQRYSGQDEIVVGSPIANRTRPDVERLIGFFVNALVMRVDLSGDPPFTQVLAQVKQTSLAAYDHQDLPFEQLVEELAPTRDPSRTPLFQVVFAMNMLEPCELDGAGLRVRILPPEISVTRFDLELHLFEADGELEATFVYSTALFDDATIAGMARHYRTLLAALVDAPDTPISAVPLLDAAERRAALEAGNDSALSGPRDVCVHELVEAQARERPLAPALIYHQQSLGYAALNARANQLAHALRARGAERDLLIGLCVERGPELVVGWLGILKSGAAYVPLDPAYPSERLAFMLEDSGLSLLVTQERLLPALPAHAARVLCLDRDGALLGAEPDHDPQQGSAPGDLVYAIYTSGSTGRPKAALLEHGGLCNLSREQTRAFGVGPGTRVLQFSSLSFDAASFELVMALTHGATLVLGDRDELMPGPDLAGFLERYAIGLVTLPPTALAATPRSELPALETITVAGEACPAELVRRWAPGRRFFNLYGPTETSIWATMAELRAGDAAHIGRPIGNVRVYLLDAHGEPQPAGLPGEICIGGRGVARGYLGRPELSAERFVDDPFSPASGDSPGRLYRTGDLGRRRSDGSLEFVGRIDQQVKLRGHRIEPGEIEHVLDGFPGVRRSHVMLREDLPGEQRLVAYVVHDGEVAPIASAAQQGQWERDHVAHWRTLYEQSYGEATEAPEAEDQTFNITSWNSSYTSAPIPADEMRQWLDHTVESILETGPERVLELGCGLGLILFRVAPHCVEYRGTDLSQAALDNLRRQLDALPEEQASRLASVRLERRDADDLSGIPDGHFDTVVLNSVAQYLPSVEHLLRVLEQAVRVLRPGGRVFVGDVRSLPLMRAFHTSVLLHQVGVGVGEGAEGGSDVDAGVDAGVDADVGAGGEADLARLRERLRQRLSQEQELLIDPAFFEALRARLPRLAGVRVEPKRGRYDNELSRFRYDVLLTLDAERGRAPEPRWLEWGRDLASEGELRQRLAAQTDDVFGVRGVPNRRTARDAAVAERLLSDEGSGTLAELLGSLDRDGSWLDPDDLRDLCAQGPYACRLSWSRPTQDGRFDVVFRRREDGAASASPGAPGAPGAAGATDATDATDATNATGTPRAAGAAGAPGVAAAAARPRPWSEYGNQPLRTRARGTLVPSLRSHLAARLPESMIPATFVLLDAFPVTPNGKLDPAALPPPDSLRPELADAFEPPRDPAEELLAGIWARALGLDRVGIRDDFFELGGDSIMSIHVVANARDAGLTFSVKDLFQHPTVAGLAAVSRDARELAIVAEQGLVTGALPLLPIQHWFFEQDPVDPQHFTQALLLEPAATLEPEPLRRALTAVCAQHDALRLRFRRGSGGWSQELAPLPAEVPLEVHDLSGLSEAEAAAGIEAHTTRLQAGLDLDSGVLLSAALFRNRAGAADTLLLIVHHLAVDAVSWLPLLQDLGRALDPALPELPRKTSSLRAWSQALSEYARSASVAAQARHWLELPWAGVPRLPCDRLSGENTVGHMREVHTALSRERSRALLQQAPKATTAGIEAVLLSALARAIAAWTERELVLVDLEGHGRQDVIEGLDVSRTVGWFTSMHPVVLRVDRGSQAVVALARTAEQLSATPDRGLPYGLARYLSDDAEIAARLAALPAAQLAFNYLGDFDQAVSGSAFRWLGSPNASSRSPRARRAHLLEVQALVTGGEFRVSWGYCPAFHDEQTVARLAQRFLAELESLIDACRLASEAVPADSPPAASPPGAEFGWSDDDMADILGDIEKQG